MTNARRTTRLWSTERWRRIRETVGGSVWVLGVSVGLPWALLEGLRATLVRTGGGLA